MPRLARGALLAPLQGPTCPQRRRQPPAAWGHTLQIVRGFPVPAVAALTALGRFLGDATLDTRSAPGSTLRSHPRTCSGGAEPPRPYPISCHYPLHCPWLCPSHCLFLRPYSHPPLPLPLSLIHLPPPVHCPCLSPDTFADWLAFPYERYVPCPQWTFTLGDVGPRR